MYFYYRWAFPGGACGKEHACQRRRHKRCRLNPWVEKIPWRRAWQPTPEFLPRELHGQRSLAGCSPWGTESDTTEATWHAQMHTAVQISRAYSFHLTEMCLLINNSPPPTPKTLVTTILIVDFMNLTTLSTSLSGIIQYFICLVYFTRYNILQVHPCCYMLPKFFVCLFVF